MITLKGFDNNDTWLRDFDEGFSVGGYAWPTAVVALSKEWVCGRSPGASLSVVSVVFSGRGLYIGLITHLEESYRGCSVWVWYRNLEKEEA
jgi:hypothetical protein